MQKYLFVEIRDLFGIVGFVSHSNIRCFICKSDECPHVKHVKNNKQKDCTIDDFYKNATNNRKPYQMGCFSSSKIPFVATPQYGAMVREKPTTYLPKDMNGKLVVEPPISECSVCAAPVESISQVSTLCGKDFICPIIGMSNIIF